jgi:hypothetical protein
MATSGNSANCFRRLHPSAFFPETQPDCRFGLQIPVGLRHAPPMPHALPSPRSVQLMKVRKDEAITDLMS